MQLERADPVAQRAAIQPDGSLAQRLRLREVLVLDKVGLALDNA